MNNMSVVVLSDGPDDGQNQLPLPSDFVMYLPFACQCMDIETRVEVTKVFITETSSDKRSKGTRPSTTRMGTATDINAHSSQIKASQESQAPDDDVHAVRLIAVYDKFSHLIKLETVRNSILPKEVLRIMGLILQYQLYLQSLHVTCKIEKDAIKEIIKFNSVVNLTELVFDGTFIKEANYYILLDNNSVIKHLSLSRCKLNDDALLKITERLVLPNEAAFSLMMLNLSSNCITDTGATYIAQMLRLNRCLRYLNIADNHLTDRGGIDILNVFIDFPLTVEELEQKRKRMFEILQQQAEAKLAPATKSKDDGKPATKSGDKKKKSAIKKVDIPEDTEGLTVNEPFDSENTICIDGILYCRGNYALAYLNIAYNNLGYLWIAKLLKVLIHQRVMDRKESLARVLYHGNPIPHACYDLIEVECLLNGLCQKKSPNKKTKK